MALIKISDTKAIRVEGVTIRGVEYVSIRQMYRKKGEKGWKHAKQGINIEAANIAKVRKATKAIQEAGEFPELDLDKGRSSDED